MDTHCPACGVALEHSLELTEEERLRAVVRSELQMQPPVVVHETVEIPVPVEEPALDAEGVRAVVEDVVEDLEEDVDELEDELAAEGDASGELEDELAAELAALDEPEPEPAPAAHEDSAPAKGHFLGRRVFG